MRRNDPSTWITKIVWLAGLVLLIWGRTYLNEQVLWRLSSGREGVILVTWIYFLIPFLTGLYLSLLLIWSDFRVQDFSLFVVILLPSLFFSLAWPLMRTVDFSRMPYLLVRLIGILGANEILPLVAGFTLLPSLRIGQPTRKRRR